MSKSLSAAAISQFTAEVKHAYQATGVLRPTVRSKTIRNALDNRFPKMGKGKATRRIPQTKVVPMGVGHTNATVTLENWNAAEYTDIFDQSQTNVEERMELAFVIGEAMNRRIDQIIIDRLDAMTLLGTHQVSTDIGGVGTNLNVAKVRRAMKILDQFNVSQKDRTFVAAASQKEAFLGETETTSSDYNSVKALVNGEIDTFLGFKFLWLGDRDEGGLPLAGAVRSCFAYHKQAMGLGVGIDMRVEVNYIADMTSWLSNGLFTAGAIDIDNEGVIEVLCTES